MRTLQPIIAIVAISVGAQVADAQVIPRAVYYQAPPTTWVQPVPVVQTMYAPPTAVYRPVLRPWTRVVTPAPATVYIAPQPVMVARPTVPVAVVQPAPVVTTRYRPILGGTVSRTWYP